MAEDKVLLKKFLTPIKTCKSYKPKFGQGAKEAGISLPQFKDLYGSDPFYSWIGLDSELMYAAHKAAGGMTSVYRQIGIGCERLFREVLVETTGYEDPLTATWSYETHTSSGKVKKLSLDGRLEMDDIRNEDVAKRVDQWLTLYCASLPPPTVQKPMNGVVFEVRQGYKSKDSKRQNADIDNATVAWSNDYLPVFAIFSAQIDGDLVLRYRNNRCGILIGQDSKDPQISLFAFCDQVLGYDLAGFFKRNRAAIKKEVVGVLETLLRPE